MKSKRTKKRKANQARSYAHQQAVLGLRRSSAADKHTNNITRREQKRRAIEQEH